jgi:hypothetical protein
LALFFAVLALCLLVARLYCVQGLTTIVRIDGGSMAESLPGEHVEIVCSHCSRRWQCDAVQWDATSHRVCPQCGTSIHEDSSVTRHPGTRVVIDHAAYWLAKPERFDVVAFEQPGATNGLAVKRIVALPGERWSIRGGDLFIDSQRVKKSYRQFREVALLVNEWKATGPSDSAWHVSDSEGWVFEPRSLRSGAQDRKTPVQDYDAYNPALTRPLNDVVDILCQAELHGEPQRLTLQIHDGYDVLVIEYHEAVGNVVARRGERQIAQANVYGAVREQCRVAWGVWDRQLFVVVNDQVVLQHALEEKSEPPQPISQPLAIRAEGDGEFGLSALRVFRDVYYLDPRGLGAEWSPSEPLGVDEYAVLGDNPPLSIDNRHWDEAIPRDKILGKVLRR